MGDLTADHIMRVQIAHDPAATVKEDEGGEDALSGTIQSDRHAAGVKVVNMPKVRRRGPKCGAGFAVLSPGLSCRNLIDGRCPEAGQVLDDCARLRVNLLHIQRRYQTRDTAPR